MVAQTEAEPMHEEILELVRKTEETIARSLLDEVLGEPSSKRAPAKPSAKQTTNSATEHAGAD